MRSENLLQARIDELEETLLQLKEQVSPSENPFFGRFGLSAQLAAVLWALYRCEMATNANLDAVTLIHGRDTRSSEGEDINRRTKVALCKLRQKLKPYGVDFITVWGIGYRMDPKHKRKLMEALTKVKKQELV